MAQQPYHVTIVSHTHWDREWYQPFQVFRFLLVELVDRLLTLLDADPEYHSFLLDGQTIVLEDYLAIRPEREADLRRHIAQGRLSIGPWHILPDEFLVSGEATVRNLMLGAQICARFGARLPIGYTPDPFGHIGQLPQILAGVNLTAAAFWRGLADEPTEVWWEAPDGTRLLSVFFRNGYGNLAWAPTSPDAFTLAVERQINRLAPHALTPYLLLLNGTDHMMPQPELPALIRAANERLRGRAVLVHGTLREHVAAVRAALDERAALGEGGAPTVRGELRSPKRSPQLPGVYSARMWIKQANAACQAALERYVEPTAALVAALGGPDRAGERWQAWRYLIENHPHDSICGCSVDEVHAEMRTRFAWCAQLADATAEASLGELARRVDAGQLPARVQPTPADPPAHAVTAAPADRVVLVFNPLPGVGAGAVEIVGRWPGPRRRLQLLDEAGREVPTRTLDGAELIFETLDLDADGLRALLDPIELGFYKGRLIRDVSLWLDGADARLEIVLPEYHTGEIGDFSALVRAIRADPRLNAVRRCRLTTYLADNVRLAFAAENVLGVGFRAYRLGSAPAASALPAPAAAPSLAALENEWLRVEADPRDGTLRVTDKATGRVMEGLNRVEDGGDRGDEYNYCAPQADWLVTEPLEPPTIEYRDEGLLGQTLTVTARYALPASLTPDRAGRSAETVELPLRSTARLAPGARRVDIHTEIENRAQDHRLRALFPCGVRGQSALVDDHFDRVERRPVHFEDTQGWAEQPVSTAAQQVFTAVEGGGRGLLVAVRGLPEYEHLIGERESALAVTLLRSVGWLSRDDLVCRPGHAGPGRATPEAQCLGAWSYDYSLIPFGGAGFDLPEAARAAYAFAAPLRALTVEAGEGTLPPLMHWLALEPAELVLTALKPAESGEGMIVRFYNSAPSPVRARLTFGLPLARVVPVNLLEEPVELAGIEVGDRSVALDVPAKRIVSLWVALRT